MRLTLALLLMAAPALAQTPAEVADALILGMMEEVAPGPAARVLTDCVLAAATEDEVAAFAAAPGPSAELGALINTLLARPAAVDCMQAVSGQ
jgi:hypothetical protein